MKLSCITKEIVAVFVEESLNSLKPNSALTMTIALVKSEGFYVTSVTDELSDDTEMQSYLKELLRIYEEELDG